MRTLGVDPGLKHTGWCLVNDGKPVDHGVLVPPAKKGRLQPEDVLGSVLPELRRIVEAYDPINAAVEQVAYYGIRRSITLPLSHVAGGIVGFLLALGLDTALLLAAQRRGVSPWRGSGRWSEHERDAFALAILVQQALTARGADDASVRRRQSVVLRRIITTPVNVHGAR